MQLLKTGTIRYHSLFLSYQAVSKKVRKCLLTSSSWSPRTNKVATSNSRMNILKVSGITLSLMFISILVRMALYFGQMNIKCLAVSKLLQNLHSPWSLFCLRKFSPRSLIPSLILHFRLVDLNFAFLVRRYSRVGNCTKSVNNCTL